MIVIIHTNLIQLQSQKTNDQNLLDHIVVSSYL